MLDRITIPAVILLGLFSVYWLNSFNEVVMNRCTNNYSYDTCFSEMYH